MLGIFAKTFNTATRTDPREHGESRAHWTPAERFDNRRDAALEAHKLGCRW